MALTNAERQARWRERQTTKLAGMEHELKSLRRSRPQAHIITIEPDGTTKKVSAQEWMAEGLTDRERRLVERANEAVHLALEDNSGVRITPKVYGCVNDAAKFWSALAKKFRQEMKNAAAIEPIKEQLAKPEPTTSKAAAKKRSLGPG